jgi:hypothetical protein
MSTSISKREAIDCRAFTMARLAALRLEVEALEHLLAGYDAHIAAVSAKPPVNRPPPSGGDSILQAGEL